MFPATIEFFAQVVHAFLFKQHNRECYSGSSALQDQMAHSFCAKRDLGCAMARDRAVVRYESRYLALFKTLL